MDDRFPGNDIKIAYLHTQIGDIEIRATETDITGIRFFDSGQKQVATNSAILEECISQLQEYFRGERQKFDLPLKPKGTGFQLKVWNELRNIPFGAVESYGGIARKIGNSKSVRAVGGANNKNPIVIVIPCHRVVGAKGQLVGFGGGIWRKKWLLQHEQQTIL